MKDRIEAELALAREIRQVRRMAAALACQGDTLDHAARDCRRQAMRLEELRSFLFPKEAAG